MHPVQHTFFADQCSAKRHKSLRDKEIINKKDVVKDERLDAGGLKYHKDTLLLVGKSAFRQRRYQSNTTLHRYFHGFLAIALPYRCIALYLTEKAVFLVTKDKTWPMIKGQIKTLFQDEHLTLLS